MKTLYIIRHAKSSWDDVTQDDFERPLNKRGETDAPRMGKRLRERNVRPDVLLTSPARRALTTCQRIADVIDYDPRHIQTDRRLYHAADARILQIVHAQDDGNDEVAVFGHNPGLTDFVNRVAQNLRLDNLPTCGVVGLRFPVASWSEIGWGTGEVVFVDYPKADFRE